eukprot:scaffold4244_cov167-Amphora_coffeaeformis.AAC.21
MGLSYQRLNVLIIYLLIFVRAAAASSPHPPFILRLRFPDGSVERVGLDASKAPETTLEEILGNLPRAQGLRAQVGSSVIEDPKQPLNSLGVSHGSLVALLSPDKTCTTSTGLQKKKPIVPPKTKRWDPFPDIAKDYHHARRRTSRKQGGLSYGDLARIQSELHSVQPQPEGPLQRIYMCRTSAEAMATQQGGGPRVALLLGTIQRERKNPTKRKKPKTSLSSTTDDEEYCTSAKVQAMWQPRTADNDSAYNASAIMDYSKAKQVLQVAEWLGLQPIGWIFTYPETDRHDKDGLPVFGPDVKTAAELQTRNMKFLGRIEGARFITLAMDGNNGATEAFQLSDVVVQMTAEGVLDGEQKGRFLETTTPVLVDGKETKKVDSVLCLVNTALLSHEGSYADGHPSAVKKTGGFTKKIKKRLTAALLGHDDFALLQTLCNFTLLVALTERLDPADAEALVTTVRKFARGQKRSTKVGMSLKRKIGVIVES